MLSSAVVWSALSNEQIIERANPSVALVLVSRTPVAGQPVALGAAVVVRPNGILLTAYHLIGDAYSIQLRFKNGEVFDRVQMLGYNERRDDAAIRITAAALPAMQVSSRGAVQGG